MNECNESYFLPLTMDSRYWDNDKKYILLDGVFKNSNFQDEKLKNAFVVNVKISPEEIFEIKSFCKEITKKLAAILNQYHNVSYSDQYWNNMLLKWIVYFSVDIFHKDKEFSELEKKINNIKLFTNIVKEKNYSYIFINDYADVFTNDEYHYYVYGKLIKYYPFLLRSYRKKQPRILQKKYNIITEDYKEGIVTKFLHRIKNVTYQKIKNKYYKFIDNGKVYVYSIRIPNKLLDDIVFQSKGKILPVTVIDIEKEKEYSIDRQFRKEINRKLSSCCFNEKWKKMVCIMLGDFLPAYYVEKYNDYRHVAISFLEKHKSIKGFFTQTGVWALTYEAALLFLAREKGIKVIGMQHGGNYGIEELPLLPIERSMSDYFYGWGEWVNSWDDKCKIGRAFQLCEYDSLSLSNDKRNKYILFGGTAVLAHAWAPNIMIHSQNEKYITRQLNLFSALGDELLKNIIVRNYYIDYGWHLNNIIKKNFPKIRISGEASGDIRFSNTDERNKSFASELINCELYLCDHLSTTWIEALYIDKPLIMILSKERYKFFIKEEKKYLNMLENVGIIHYDINEAANYIKKGVVSDVDKWWNESERKKVVEIVRDRYCKREKDIIKFWNKELLSLVEDD